MLIIKSKYKIAKRLGAGIFEQTQTQKFSLSEARSKGNKQRGGRRGGSDYGRQLLEKQRVRFTYGLSERQFSSYVEAATHAPLPSAALHKLLEMRIDNTIYRAGLASTRRAARQAVSHGHILINGRRITSPSHAIREGDTITVREGSSKSSLFTSLSERAPDERRAAPRWLEVDLGLLVVKVVGVPLYQSTEVGLDYSTVFEFYSR